jgi:hypothetical protein
MKIQKIVRVQAMLMGLGAMLLLASGARAQQDMSPDTFDVNPGTPSVDTAVAAPTAPAAVAAESMNSESVVPAASENGDDAKTLALVMASAGLITLCVMMEKRRGRRAPFSRQSAPYSPAS